MKRPSEALAVLSKACHYDIDQAISPTNARQILAYVEGLEKAVFDLTFTIAVIDVALDKLKEGEKEHD